MASTPHFLQGIFSFTGKGLTQPFLLDPTLVYVVPQGITAQPVYFRGGNSTPELIAVTLLRDGSPMRHFPIGALSSVNIPLRIVEDVEPDSRLELVLAAPPDISGQVIVDFGLMEV